MLSAFPTLLSYSQISPLIIRITLGVIFIYWAHQAFKNFRADTAPKSSHSYLLVTIASLETVAGLLLIMGMWVQIAAIYVVVDLVVRIVDRIRNKAFLTNGVNYYLVVLVIAISILVTGAGIWAIDLSI